MKIKNLLCILAASLFVASCTRDYDAPPLNPPVYDGEANLTIKGLKEKYADISTPTRIELDYVIKGYVVGNDESGNIYKQLYVQDETGALSIGIDQNSIAATHRVGQEVFISLHQLFILKYGGELQLGYDVTNANRIPWEIYTTHVHFNGHPDRNKAKPQVVTIDNLTDDMVNSLVQINSVYFVNGGKQNFTIDDKTTEQTVRDANGSSINVRTSSFSTFANDTLPSGYGTIVGILGRYNGSWQFTLRNTDDLIDFGLAPPPTPGPGTEEVVMNETFGEGYYPSGNRPKIAEFTDFQAPSPISYADQSGNADIRSMSGGNGAHVWFPANKDAYLTISNINTSGKQNLELSFQLAANLYNPGEAIDLNVVKLKIGGNDVAIPSTPVSNANGDNSKFYTFTFDNIPETDNLVIEFYAPGDANTLGLRLDNIKIATKKESINPT